MMINSSSMDHSALESCTAASPTGGANQGVGCDQKKDIIVSLSDGGTTKNTLTPQGSNSSTTPNGNKDLLHMKGNIEK